MDIHHFASYLHENTENHYSDVIMLFSFSHDFNYYYIVGYYYALI